MGIFDKLMDTMHLGNDYEDDYDDYDDDFDDEPEPRGSLFKKKDKKYDYDLGDDGASGSEKVKPVKQQPARIMPLRSKKEQPVWRSVYSNQLSLMSPERLPTLC